MNVSIYYGNFLLNIVVLFGSLIYIFSSFKFKDILNKWEEVLLDIMDLRNFLNDYFKVCVFKKEMIKVFCFLIYRV